MFTVLYRFAHEAYSKEWKKLEFEQDHAPTFHEFVGELRQKRFRRNQNDVFELHRTDGTIIDDLNQPVTTCPYLLVRRYPPHPRIVLLGRGSIIHWMM